MLDIAEGEQREFSILSDCNSSFLNKKEYKILHNIVSQYQSIQLNDTVTRQESGTIIDHIYASCIESILSSGITKMGLSDHSPIYVTIKMT